MLCIKALYLLHVDCLVGATRRDGRPAVEKHGLRMAAQVLAEAHTQLHEGLTQVHMQRRLDAPARRFRSKAVTAPSECGTLNSG